MEKTSKTFQNFVDIVGLRFKAIVETAACKANHEVNRKAAHAKMEERKKN